MSDEIDVKDIPPGKLLAALYNNGRALGMGILQSRDGAMTEAEADALISGETNTTDYPDGGPKSDGKKRYFDYLHGRPMKIEVGGDTVRPGLYDRDNGTGAVQRVVDLLREAA